MVFVSADIRVPTHSAIPGREPVSCRKILEPGKPWAHLDTTTGAPNSSSARSHGVPGPADQEIGSSAALVRALVVVRPGTADASPIGAQSSSSARYGRIAFARSWSSALRSAEAGARASVSSNLILGVVGSNFIPGPRRKERFRKEVIRLTPDATNGRGDRCRSGSAAGSSVLAA